MLRPSVGPVSRSRAASGAPIRPPREGRGGRRGPGPAVSGTGVRLRDPSRRSAPSRINERPPVFDPERTETIRTVLPRSDPAFPSLSPGGRVRAGSAPPVGHRPRPAPPGALPARRPRPPLEEPRAAAPPRPCLLPVPCRSPARRMARSPPRALRHGVGFPPRGSVSSPLLRGLRSPTRAPRAPPGPGSARPSLPRASARFLGQPETVAGFCVCHHRPRMTLL